MVMYELLHLLQAGVVNSDPYVENILAKNKFYFLPVLNVDGVAAIEEDHMNTGHIKNILEQRKNMNPNATSRCRKGEGGIDLNRNFGYEFDKRRFIYSHDYTDPCFEFYAGEKAFSEPESRAIKSFMEDHKDEVKFVVNFHSSGNGFIWPFNAHMVNDKLETLAPGVKEIMTDITRNAEFPKNLATGNAYQAMAETMSGDADDWVTSTFKIPSVTSEIGYFHNFEDHWLAKTK